MRELTELAARSIVFITHKLQGGPGGRGRRHRHPPRARSSGRPPDDHRAELASIMVGRAVELDVWSGGTATAAARPCSVSGELVATDGSGGRSAVDGVSFEVRAGEILGDRRRAGQRPDRALPGAHGPAAGDRGSIRLDGKDISRRQRTATGSGAGRRLRPRGQARRRARRPTSRWRRTSCSIMYDRPPIARGIAMDLRRSARTPHAGSPSSTSGRSRSDTPAAARCPAETSRRWCSPARSSRPLRLLDRQPADARRWTSGRSSSCTAGSWSERDQGIAVIIVSTELDEVLALADRIARHVPGQDHRLSARRTRRRPAGPAHGRVRAGDLDGSDGANGAASATADGCTADDGRRSGHQLTGRGVGMTELTPEPARRRPSRARPTEVRSRAAMSGPPCGPGSRPGCARQRGHASSRSSSPSWQSFSALVLGALVIASATRGAPRLRAASSRRPADTIWATWDAVAAAYSALFEGAIFNPNTISAASTAASWSDILPAVAGRRQGHPADPDGARRRRSRSGPACSTSAVSGQMRSAARSS